MEAEARPQRVADEAVTMVSVSGGLAEGVDDLGEVAFGRITVLEVTDEALAVGVRGEDAVQAGVAIVGEAVFATGAVADPMQASAGVVVADDRVTGEGAHCDEASVAGLGGGVPGDRCEVVQATCGVLDGVAAVAVARESPAVAGVEQAERSIETRVARSSKQSSRPSSAR
ncbi:hypothetical protein [Nannocystis pusilla]|uniref:hypothetical protein n=1 Tax=Nannocystis pusilla TaxID=889268 RepID=UPI003B77F13C